MLRSEFTLKLGCFGGQRTERLTHSLDRPIGDPVPQEEMA